MGVARPLAPPDESCELMLTALSRVGGARGLRPAAVGLFAGGAGGAGLAFAAATALPLGAAFGATGGGGGGAGLAAATAISSR